MVGVVLNDNKEGYMSIIEIKNVTKTYCPTLFKKSKSAQTSKRIVAVDNVSLTVQEGEIFGLVGSNGAGKTTLIKTMLNLAKVDSGSISICGYDSQKESKKMLQNVGAIVEEPTLFKEMTGMQNLKMLAEYHSNVSQERIEQVVDIVGLRERINSPFSTYSLGMRQRLGIAQAILHSPKVLILDEPINGFDPQGILQMRELFKRLSREYGTTILISSHILSEMEELCDRVGIMKNGQIVVVDTIENLRDNMGSELLVCIECSDSVTACGLVNNMLGYPTKIVGGKLYVKCAKQEDVNEVIKALLGGNLEIFAVNTIKKNLEQIYLEVVK